MLRRKCVPQGRGLPPHPIAPFCANHDSAHAREGMKRASNGDMPLWGNQCSTGSGDTLTGKVRMGNTQRLLPLEVPGPHPLPHLCNPQASHHLFLPQISACHHGYRTLSQGPWLCRATTACIRSPVKIHHIHRAGWRKPYVIITRFDKVMYEKHLAYSMWSSNGTSFFQYIVVLQVICKK